jgi:hypothetical protein
VTEFDFRYSNRVALWIDDAERLAKNVSSSSRSRS